MDKTSKGSKTLLEAALRAMAKEGSGEACSQLGLRYRMQNDWKKAKDWFEKAVDNGDPWGALAMDAHALAKAGDGELGFEDGVTIAGDVMILFKSAVSRHDIPAVLANEAYRLYLAVRDEHEHSASMMTVDALIARSGLLSEANLYSFAKLILEEVSSRYSQPPAFLPFLKEKGLTGLSLAMAVHDLGAVYEHGVSGIANADPETAARLYAEAFTYYARFEHAAAFENIEQDPEFANDGLIERLILENSFAQAAPHKVSLDLAGAYSACAYDVSTAIGEKILELGTKDPKAPLIGTLLEILDRASEGGNLHASRLLRDLCNDGRFIKGSKELEIKILKRLAEAGDLPSQSALAAQLLSGLGGRKDPKKARVWYQKAADAWDDGAMAFFAQNYAAEAKKGSQAALLRRGHCFEHGLGVKADPQRAFECYLKLSDPLMRNARIALLEQRRGNQERAQKYLGKALEHVAGHFDAKTKEMWSAYLDGCDLESGITKAQNPVTAIEYYLKAGGMGFRDHELNDFADRLKRCHAFLTSPKDQEICRERFEAEKQVSAGMFQKHGDPLTLAQKLCEESSCRPVYVCKPEDLLAPAPEDPKLPAARLAQMLPRLKEYVFDTRVFSDDGAPEKSEQIVREYFKERTLFTLETGIVATSLNGNPGDQDNLRFLILSEGLKEITEPDFAKYHAAVIPAWDRFQILGVHAHAGRFLVIVLHQPDYLNNDPVCHFRINADARCSPLLKPYCDRFDALDGTEPKLNFYDEYLAKTDHFSLSQEHTADLAAYFADKQRP